MPRLRPQVQETARVYFDNVICFLPAEKGHVLRFFPRKLYTIHLHTHSNFPRAFVSDTSLVFFF